MKTKSEITPLVTGIIVGVVTGYFLKSFLTGLGLAIFVYTLISLSWSMVDDHKSTKKEEEY